MDRQELEAIWNETHPELPCDSPLHTAIITEALEAGEDASPTQIAATLYHLSEDIEDFADAIGRGGH